MRVQELRSQMRRASSRGGGGPRGEVDLLLREDVQGPQQRTGRGTTRLPPGLHFTPDPRGEGENALAAIMRERGLLETCRSSPSSAGASSSPPAPLSPDVQKVEHGGRGTTGTQWTGADVVDRVSEAMSSFLPPISLLPSSGSTGRGAGG